MTTGDLQTNLDDISARLNTLINFDKHRYPRRNGVYQG